jgi:diaminopimelate decarboxylase
MVSISGQLQEALKSIQPPCYVLDLVELQATVDASMRMARRLNIQYAYSYKTNYLRDLCLHLHKNGILAEVVSPFEVDVTKAYGIPPDRVVYNGPVKSRDSIAYVLIGGGLVNSDSLHDLELITGVAYDIHRPGLRVGVRVSFPMPGVSSSRFGLDLFSSDLQTAIHTIREHPYLSLDCLHCHFPNRDPLSFFQRLERLAGFLETNALEFKTIDIGGGLPSDLDPSVAAQLGFDHVDYEDYTRQLEDGLSLLRRFSKATVIMEPGTMFAAKSLSLLASIRTIKTNQGHTYYTLDVSRTNVGGLRQSISFPHVVLGFTRLSDPSGCQSFVGFTCVEGDNLGAPLYGPLSVGDRVLFTDIGSYSAVFKSPFINPDLPVYTWDGNDLRLSRRGQDVKDVLGCDVV